MLEWFENKNWNDDIDLIRINNLPVQPQEGVPFEITDLIKKCLIIMIYDRPTATEIQKKFKLIRDNQAECPSTEEPTEKKPDMSPLLQNFFSKSNYFK